MTFLRRKIQPELTEIVAAQITLGVEAAAMLEAADAENWPDATKHARAAAEKAGQLRIMLDHIADVAERDAKLGADDFEDSNQVYEGAKQ